jgi:hypothetical protein
MIAAQTPPERSDTTRDRDLTVRVVKATLMDVLVVGHESPTEQPRRLRRSG